MMQRYCLRDGVLCPPPRCGVTRTGRALTNFAWRVQNDGDFAVANGYYPMGAVRIAEPPAREGIRTEIAWQLVDGYWQCSFTQTPIADDELPD